MRCHLCGKEIADDSTLCPYCGTRIKAPSHGEHTAPTADNRAKTDEFFDAPPKQAKTDEFFDAPTQQAGKDEFFDAPPSRPAPTQQAPAAPFNKFALIGFALSFIAAVIGLGVSIVGLFQCIRQRERGMGFAIAGIVIGALSIVLYVLIYVTRYDILKYL